MAFLEAVLSIYPDTVDDVWNICLETLEMVGLEEKEDELISAFEKNLEKMMKNVSCDQLGQKMLDLMLRTTRALLNREYPHLELTSCECGRASYISINDAKFIEPLYKFIEPLRNSNIDPVIIRNVIRSEMYRYFYTPEEFLEFCQRDTKEIFDFVSAASCEDSKYDITVFDSVRDLGVFGQESLGMTQKDPEEAGKEMLRKYQEGQSSFICIALTTGSCLFAEMTQSALLMNKAELEEDGSYLLKIESREQADLACTNCSNCWHRDVCVIDRNSFPLTFTFSLPENWGEDISVTDKKRIN